MFLKHNYELVLMEKRSDFINSKNCNTPLY